MATYSIRQLTDRQRREICLCGNCKDSNYLQMVRPVEGEWQVKCMRCMMMGPVRRSAHEAINAWDCLGS